MKSVGNFRTEKLLCRSMRQTTYNTTGICLSPSFYALEGGKLECSKCGTVYTVKQILAANKAN